MAASCCLRAITILAVMGLAGCGQNDDWTGFVYPDRNALTVSTEIGKFRTFDQCRAASLRTLKVFGRSEGGAFECGRSCSLSTTTGMSICAETRD